MLQIVNFFALFRTVTRCCRFTCQRVATLVVIPFIPLLYAVEVTTAPPLPHATEAPFFAPMGDGRILITGFTTFDPSSGNTPINAAYAYNPATNVYDSISGSLFASSYGSAFTDVNGDVIVSRQTISKCERYSVSSNSWAELTGVISNNTAWGESTAVDSNIRLAVGPYGNQFVRLNGNATAWTSAVARPHTLIAPALCSDQGGGFYACGGLFPSTWLGSHLVNIYHPGTDSWTSAPSMIRARGGAAALRIDATHILVVGGYASSEIFDTTAQSWTEVGAIATPSSWAFQSDKAPLAALLPNGQVIGQYGLFDPNNNTVRSHSGPTMFPTYVGNGRLVWCGSVPQVWSLKATVADHTLASVHDTHTPLVVDLVEITSAFDRDVSYTIVNNSTHGTSTLVGSILQYIPNPGYAGSDVIQVTASDPTFGQGRTASITVSMTNAQPVTSDIMGSYHHDATATGRLIATDADADTLNWTVITPPSTGTFLFTDATLGNYEYTPSPFTITDAIIVCQVSDGITASICTVTLHGGNDEPIAQSVVVTINEGSPYAGLLSGSNTDGDPLIWTIISPPTHGTFTLTNASTGACTYIPAIGQFDGAVIGFSVTDGVATATATLTIHINRVNHQPSFSLSGDLTVNETPLPHVISGWVVAVDMGSPYETDQQVVRYVVVTDHPEWFRTLPALSADGTLTFTPAGNVDSTSIATLTLLMEDSGTTSNGGNNRSLPVYAHITLQPVADLIIVASKSDTGLGTLRTCLTEARAGDTIIFDPTVFGLTNSNAATIINVLSPLPTITHPSITIDAKQCRITINGSAAGTADGLVIAADDCTILGLSLVGFTGSGIVLSDAADTQLGGDRTTGTGPNGSGLRIAGCGAYGIWARGTNCHNNRIQGCWVGLSSSGTHSEANLAGIFLDGGASSNIIGGATTGLSNRIAGNKFEGIVISGLGSDNNQIIGNEIGGGPSWWIPNGTSGIFISQGTNGTVVGAAGSGTDDQIHANDIRGNGTYGIEIRTSTSAGNSSHANRIRENALGAIGLFDGCNSAVKQPIGQATIATAISIAAAKTDLSPVTTTAPVPLAIVNIRGTAPSAGTVELFNDAVHQGGVFLKRCVVSEGAWSTSVRVDLKQSITATYTDEMGNTSSFAVIAEAGAMTEASNSTSISENSDKCGLGGVGIVLLAVGFGFLKRDDRQLRMSGN